MSNAASLSISLGQARRKEADAKIRREKYQVADDVRAERAVMIATRENKMTEATAEAKAAQESAPTAFAAVLARATLEELGEITRMIGRLDGRRLQAIADDAFRTKGRERIANPPELAQEAAQAAKVSSPTRTR